MRYAIDPRQRSLFNPASAMFSPMTLKYLSSDWPGVFRHQMLHLMPADALGKHFSQMLGCPTKELYRNLPPTPNAFDAVTTGPEPLFCVSNVACTMNGYI